MKGGHASRSRTMVIGGQTYKATWAPFHWEIELWGWEGAEVSWKPVGSADNLREARRLMAEHSLKALRAVVS